MEKTLLIDPNMFELHSETAIENNLCFFRKIIRLCDSGKLVIALYQGLFERIRLFPYTPFPIFINDIHNSTLKGQVLILNRNFYQILSNSKILPVDIDSCNGSQEFTSDPDLSDDSRYYELLSVMLTTCYRGGMDLAPYVLVGEPENGLKAGTQVLLKCVCTSRSFEQNYKWTIPDDFEDAKDRAFDLLQKSVNSAERLFVSEPETVRGDHHCPLQNKPIKKYQDFSTSNKRVLTLLRYFGLFKIILSDFHEDSSYAVGTIIIDKVRYGSDSEIAEGWLFCQTKFKSRIELYFPVGIGKALCIYLDNILSYKETESLKSKLGI